MSNVDEIEPLVPQRVENAIKKRLNQRAAESCKPLIEAYVKYFNPAVVLSNPCQIFDTLLPALVLAPCALPQSHHSPS